ncbi:MAG: RagB/SusD family nutrient uptake outer membrane protein [Bacteroides sp.]|nr:RagB/SusD family nutrient uptake outer membrane protein [Bacteroides sp.]
MKKTYLTLLCLGALLATSCDDYLDVRPKGEKVENEIFDSAKGFEDAIYGVYGYMSSESTYGKNLVWGVPEILAQNLHSGRTGSAFDDLGKYKFTENSQLRSVFSQIWKTAYENIGYANNILQNLEKRSASDFHLYNLYKGEMLGVRAMLHFDLLRLFASVDKEKRGIPYVKTFDFSVKPFSTVGECLDFIVADLLEAEKLMAEDETIVYPRDDAQYEEFNRYRETHMNLYAVKALLARAYWYMGNQERAAYYAQEVINSGRFPLVDITEIQTYMAGVLSPKETIFGVYSVNYLQTSTDCLYTWSSNYDTYIPFTNYADIYNLDVPATAQDYRRTHFREDTSAGVKCFKMVDYLTIENNGISTRPQLIAGITLIHSSEMYLIAADALLNSNYPLALKYYNEEIASRGLTPLRDSETLTADMIFNEYRKEMFCEGQHWYNMKRLKRNIESNNENRTIEASDVVYVLPIPEEEFEFRTEDNR